jgi:hypothetical protein
MIESRRIRWAGHVAYMGGKGERIQGFSSEARRKGPLGRPRRRWDNIKMDLQEIDGMVWVGFIWLRIGTVVGSYGHSEESLGIGKLFISQTTVGFSRNTPTAAEAQTHAI